MCLKEEPSKKIKLYSNVNNGNKIIRPRIRLPIAHLLYSNL